jgi:hypothetical protein
MTKPSPSITAFAAILAIAVLIASFVAFRSRADPEPGGPGWSVAAIRHEEPFFTAANIVVDAAPADRASALKNAVAEICGKRPHGATCSLSFYLLGQRLPHKTSPLRAGKEETDEDFAEWWQRQDDRAGFNHWDCEVAGVAEAPPGALCGSGVKEGYDAILPLGFRAGAGEQCHWQARPKLQADFAAVIAFAAKSGHDAMFRQGFNDMVTSGRTPRGHFDTFNCSTSQKKIGVTLDEHLAKWRSTIQNAPGNK